MSGFIEGEDRRQATLFPERIDDYIAEDSPVRVIDVFVDDLDLSGLGFKTVAEVTGRPGYHPATLLKLFIYGYLNRVQSSRRLERDMIIATRDMLLTIEARNCRFVLWHMIGVPRPMETSPCLNLKLSPSRQEVNRGLSVSGRQATVVQRP